VYVPAAQYTATMCELPAPPVPGVPQNALLLVRDIRTSDFIADISWQPPVPNSGLPVLYYYIEQLNAQGGRISMQSFPPGPNNTGMLQSYTIGFDPAHIGPDKNQSFRICAVNAQGQGPWTDKLLIDMRMVVGP